MAPKISRRNFITGGAAIASTAVLAGCEQGTRWVFLEPYVRPPEEQLDGVPTYYASTCRQCSAGCGILARVMNGRALKLEGNPEHPLNRGKLCAQGQSGPQLLYNPDRLYRPLQTVKRGGGDFATVPWDSALSVLAGKIKDAGNAVAVLATPNMSGHLYDLLQRFTKAIGAPAPVIWDLQTAWNGNVTLATTAEPLFGKAGVPAYNVSGADVIYSFGADIVGTWESPTRYNMDYGQFRTQPKGLRGYLAQFEPYMSLTGAKADKWVGLRPGYEGLVAQAIARLIADGKFGPPEWQARAAAVAGNVDPAAVATASQVSLEQLTQLAKVYAEANHPVAVPGNALAGPDAVAAVQGLNIITGGAGIVLSADLPSTDLVRPMPSTYADLQKLITQMAGGAVKVLLIYGANPVYELPPAAGFMDALNQVGYVVTTTTMMTETAASSNLVLPDRTYLESWGYTVVAPNFGMPMVSSQQPVVQPVQDVRSPGDVLVAAAKNVPAATSAFPWSDEVAFLKEIVLKLPAGAAGGTGADLLWARFLQHGGWWPGQAPAPVPVKTGNPPNAAVTPPPPQGDPAQYPFELHPFPHILLGVGGGANIPWLQGSPEPLTSIAWQTWACVHPDTAKTLGVQKGDVVRLTTPYGEVEAEVYVTPVIRADTIAIPFGQGHTVYGRYAENRGANAVHLLGGQPGPGGLEPNWAGLRCKVTPTGQTARVATLEFTPGVEAGFFNKSFPGQ